MNLIIPMVFELKVPQLSIALQDIFIAFMMQVNR